MLLDRLRRQWQRIASGDAESFAVGASPRTYATHPSEPGRASNASAAPDCAATAGDFSLERLVQGVETSNARGSYYLIRRRLSQCWAPNRSFASQFATAMQAATIQNSPAPDSSIGFKPPATPPRKINSVDAEFATLSGSALDALLFMDIESCGFAGNPLFLIGVMFWHDNDLITEQVLARSYEQEPQVIHHLGDLLVGRNVLISFNGKSFDWPFVCDRAAVHRVRLRLPKMHCDLLHTSRRRFRHTLPDCRLQTLESRLLGRRRTGDIAGSDIPAAYHDFVRTGDARAMRDIVHHNFLDLITLAELVVRIAADVNPHLSSSFAVLARRDLQIARSV